MLRTAEEIAAFFDTLDADCAQHTPHSEWTFSNGDPLFICTHSARRVAARFGGRVSGVDREMNPFAVIADDHDGHDFALVGERFVVDYWAFRVTCVLDRGVFDLNNADDRAEIARLYGPSENWQTLPNPFAEAQTHEQKPQLDAR